MASEGRDLVKEAIQDAKSLKEAALESARQQIVEGMTPAVRKLLDESIRGALSERSRTGGSEWDKSPEGGTRQQKKDYGELATNEGSDPLDSALHEFFPTDGGVKESTDMAGEVNEKKSSGKKGSKSVNEVKSSGKKSSEIHEEIEISESELRKVYEAALQTEVQVKKGFSDIVGGGEMEDASKEAGILPKGGEKQFADVTPPNKKDWTVKEAIEKGLAENKQLRENLRKAATMIKTLGTKLHEVNLFNAKVLHVNKLLNSGLRLTKEQKTYVMESIDKAQSIGQVKMVYETIVGGFKTQQALTESRNPRVPKADAQRARTTGTPKQDVLSESVDRAQNTGKYSRIQMLAGIVNGKKE